jgi:hypothetical protein
VGEWDPPRGIVPNQPGHNGWAGQQWPRTALNEDGTEQICFEPIPCADLQPEGCPELTPPPISCPAGFSGWWDPPRGIVPNQPGHNDWAGQQWPRTVELEDGTIEVCFTGMNCTVPTTTPGSCPVPPPPFVACDSSVSWSLPPTGNPGPSAQTRSGTLNLPAAQCRETFTNAWSSTGRIGWQHNLHARNPGGVSGNWSVIRQTQNGPAGMFASPCSAGNTTGFCATGFWNWQQGQPWVSGLNNHLENPLSSNIQLNNHWNTLRNAAQTAITNGNLENPPNFNITPNNQQGLQEGALFDIQTRDRWSDIVWSVTRTRERDRRVACVEFPMSEIVTYCETSCWDDEWGGGCDTWCWDVLYVWSEWEWQWATNNSQANTCSPTGPTPTTNDNIGCTAWRLRAASPLLLAANPSDNGWQDNEWRSLVSSRCNANNFQGGINAIPGTRQANPSNVSNNFFGVVLTPVGGSNQLSGLNSTFFNSIESCRNQIRCVNDVGASGSASSINQLHNFATQHTGDIQRWGTTHIDNGILRSSNRISFARDNQWNQFWVDQWRPRIENVGPGATQNRAGSWNWMPANEAVTDAATQTILSAHPPHRTQMRFINTGTPGIAADRGGFTFQSRQGFSSSINTRVSANSNQLWIASNLASPWNTPRTELGEHTQFRTRASWASDHNAPHNFQSQYIYNANINTWSPTVIVGGPAGNRASVSGQNTTSASFVPNNFDVWCRTTYNTNSPQEVVARWHNLWGTDHRVNNRTATVAGATSPADANVSLGRVNFGDTNNSWTENRTLRITFVRPVGE